MALNLRLLVSIPISHTISDIRQLFLKAGRYSCSNPTVKAIPSLYIKNDCGTA